MFVWPSQVSARIHHHIHRITTCGLADDSDLSERWTNSALLVVVLCFHLHKFGMFFSSASPIACRLCRYCDCGELYFTWLYLCIICFSFFLFPSGINLNLPSLSLSLSLCFSLSMLHYLRLPIAGSLSTCTLVAVTNPFQWLWLCLFWVGHLFIFYVYMSLCAKEAKDNLLICNLCSIDLIYSMPTEKTCLDFFYQ